MKILYQGNIYEHFNYNNPIVGGGGGDNTNPPMKELLKGQEVEKEHVGNLDNKKNIALADDISRDHIAEFPDYYSDERETPRVQP